MSFDLDDACEGLATFLEDLGNALGNGDLEEAADVTHRLYDAIQEAIAQRDEAEDDEEEDSEDE
jgi:hypothetical protein